VAKRSGSFGNSSGTMISWMGLSNQEWTVKMRQKLCDTARVLLDIFMTLCTVDTSLYHQRLNIFLTLMFVANSALWDLQQVNYLGFTSSAWSAEQVLQQQRYWVHQQSNHCPVPREVLVVESWPIWSSNGEKLVEMLIMFMRLNWTRVKPWPPFYCIQREAKGVDHWFVGPLTRTVHFGVVRVKTF